MSDQKPCHVVWWDETNGVARTDWLPGAVCTIDVALAVSADVRALGQGLVLSLVDLRPLRSIDRESREHFMGDHAHYRAVALVATSPVSRVIANFFLALNSGQIPVRMFTDMKAATEWLGLHR